MEELTVVRHIPEIERRCLEGLRYHTDRVGFARPHELNGPFQSIDFWSAARLSGAGVIFTTACARWQSHSGQVANTVEGTLVRSDAHVALVFVAVRPETFSGTEVSRSCKVAHRPETGPEATHITSSG